MKNPRVTITSTDTVKPYYNSLTFDSYRLPDSGTEKSEEIELNSTGRVIDL